MVIAELLHLRRLTGGGAHVKRVQEDKRAARMRAAIWYYTQHKTRRTVYTSLCLFVHDTRVGRSIIAPIIVK